LSSFSAACDECERESMRQSGPAREATLWLAPSNRSGGNMGSIIGWAIFGLIAGAIAKLIMPGKDPGGIFVTMLLGIAGAEVGGLIGRALWGSSGVSGWGMGSWLLAIGGSLLLLFLYRVITGRRSAAATTKTGDRGRWAA